MHVSTQSGVLCPLFVPLHGLAIREVLGYRANKKSGWMLFLVLLNSREGRLMSGL